MMAGRKQAGIEEAHLDLELVTPFCVHRGLEGVEGSDDAEGAG
jgi:hypothetical protein